MITKKVEAKKREQLTLLPASAPIPVADYPGGILLQLALLQAAKLKD